jgi:preprotein translocase subunit SecA
MSSSGFSWTLPPLVAYPEQRERPDSWTDRLEAQLTAWPMALWPRMVRGREMRFVASVNRLEQSFGSMDTAALWLAARDLRGRLRGALDDDALVAESFALVREVASRELGMRHFDVQLRGGFALLHGRVAEMETGEGKTLTAILAAATAALAGVPVHVVTVNDYLAGRDAAGMEKVYRALGLNVGTIVHGLAPEQRRAAYACDITYGSNKEMAFDYLRDRLALADSPGNLALKLRRLLGGTDESGGVVMRGLHFAIVDEADSVLVDEARTPLIISRQTDSDDERRWAEAALQLADELDPERHYKLLREERRIELTREGRERLNEIGEAWGGIWQSRIRREESARQALTAVQLFQAGDHYLVRDGKVQIIDEYTGRIMADRSWSEGLHQLVEAKEGCEVTSRKIPVARMTYQRFFRRYRRLAGMTGTGHEVGSEFWRVYQLPVVRIPTNRPVQRQRLAARFYPTAEEKWSAVVARAEELRAQGRPVLIGTRSVDASETVSTRLQEAGVEHVVLNAAQDEDEAEIIAQAGQLGRVTVATNMAGRGVDIQLPDEVLALGGLHVILTERHDARRIDRQLEGRCGRQGDPGSTEALLSLEDPLLELVKSSPLLRASHMAGGLGRLASRRVFAKAQGRAERAHARARYELLKQDRKLGVVLAFSGGME